MLTTSAPKNVEFTKQTARYDAVEQVNPGGDNKDAVSLP